MNDTESYETSDGRYSCSYCSPRDVMSCVRMIDYNDPNRDIIEPSDSTHPTYDELVFRISVNESKIDRMTKNSWRENRERSKLYNIGTYWHDINGRRDDYWKRGGNFVQLRKDILPWDPSKGDKLEIRSLSGGWADVTEAVAPETEGMSSTQFSFWFDYRKGTLFVRTGYLAPTQNAIRISYRYGNTTEDVPPEIARCCALMTALMVINEDVYMTKIGTGGDLGSARNEMKKAMQDEINETIKMHQRFGAVYSLYN